MDTDETLAHVADVTVMNAWQRQVHIQELVELIADEFVHRIQPLVRTRSAALIEEMREEHGLSEDSFASAPDQDSRTAAELYPNLLYSSLFVASYFAFERALHEICRALHRAQGHSVRPNEIAGTGVRRSRVYIRKIAGFKFPKDEHRWQRISDLHELRNILAHNGGQIEPDLTDKRIIQIVQKDPELSVGPGGSIQFSSQFVSDACFLMQDLLLELSLIISASTDQLAEVLEREFGADPPDSV